MSTAPNPPEPDRAQFDRIVSHLRADAARSGGPRRSPTSDRPTLADFGFAVACLAVIVPLSMVVGGWVGLLFLSVAVFVAARLLSVPHRRRR